MEQALQNWIDKIQIQYKLENPNPINDCKFSFIKGAKYYKVVRDYHGQRSVHSFVDNEGNIWKAAGWKAPTKNFSRGNILNNPPISTHF